MPKARALLWISTLAGVAMLGYSLVLGPPPLWIALASFCGYVGLCTVGVVFPRLEMFADVVSAGVRGRGWIALTFDDGPDPRTTRRVLATLAAGGHRATFFVIGAKAERHPEVIREICDQGHEIAVHAYEHSRLYSFWAPSRIERDIERARTVLEGICGVRPVLFRPPVGHVSPRTAAGSRRAKVKLIAWTVRALDGIPFAKPEAVARRVERGLSDGSIVMLHDAAERDTYEPAAVEALPRILRAIEARSLRTVTLSELLEPSP